MIDKYILIAPLLLLGCATFDGTTRNKSDLVFRSAKDAPTVARCLAEQWKTFSPPGGAAVPVTQREWLGSYTLTANCTGGKSCKLAEVNPALDDQSKITLYTIAIDDSRYLDAVSYCQ